MKPIIPIIHQNGTHPDRLVEALSDFHDGLYQLCDLLGSISPNGRDYYPQPGLMDAAVAQHQRRSKVLTDLAAEIVAEIEGIQEQSASS